MCKMKLLTVGRINETVPEAEALARVGCCFRRMSSPTEKALQLLRYLPRVNLENIVKNPYGRQQFGKRRGKTSNKGKAGYGQKGFLQRARYLPLGFESPKGTPFYLRQPAEEYYKDVMHRRQYPPLTLYQLQSMIDSGKIDPSQPIDLTSLCATNHYHIDANDNQYGVQLTDEGLDVFKAKVNIEVQHASEPVIAAIERNGGVIRCAYFDILSVKALVDPLKYFQSGQPIPKRLFPPPDAIGMYSDPSKRGYLADPVKIAEERLKLAQKFGYELPDLTKDDQYKMLRLHKDPRQ
ncbi:39S ribosomal protein L15, mitochondrial [Halotydeus destructor]|nr:39S ribosomal protein L15, mitochondrial [Halotydeus destructor]